MSSLGNKRAANKIVTSKPKTGRRTTPKPTRQLKPLPQGIGDGGRTCSGGYFCMHEGGYMNGTGIPHNSCESCVAFSQDATSCEGHCGEFTLCYYSNNHDSTGIPVNSDCECSSLPINDGVCELGGSCTGNLNNCASFQGWHYDCPPYFQPCQFGCNNEPNYCEDGDNNYFDDFPCNHNPTYPATCAGYSSEADCPTDYGCAWPWDGQSGICIAGITDNEILCYGDSDCNSAGADDCTFGDFNWYGGWSCDTYCVTAPADDCAQPSFCQYCDYIDGWENDNGDLTYECQDNGAPIYMCNGSWNPGDTCNFYGISIFQGFCDCSGFCRFDWTGDQGDGLIDNGCCENCQTVDCAPTCPGGGPHGDLISCDRWEADSYDCSHMNCNQLLYEIQNDASEWSSSEWFEYIDLHCGQNISDYVDHYMNLENGYTKAKTAWYDFIASPSIDITTNIQETVNNINAELGIIKNKKDDIRDYFLVHRQNAFDNSTIEDLIQEIEEAVNNIRNTTIVVTLTWDNQYLKPWNEGIKMMDDAVVNLKQFKFTDMARGCFKHIAKLFKCGIEKLNDLLSTTKDLVAEYVEGCGDGNINDNPCDAFEGTILGQDVIILLDDTYTVFETLPFNCGRLDIDIKFGISSVQAGDVSVTWDTGATTYEQWKAGTPFEFIITMDGIRIYSPLQLKLNACGTHFDIDMGHLWFGTWGDVNSRNYWFDPSGNLDEWLSLVIFQFNVSAITDEETGVLTNIGFDMPINTGWNMLGNSGNMGIQNPYINFVDTVPGFDCNNCGWYEIGNVCDEWGSGTCAPWWAWPCHTMTAACFAGWLIENAISIQLNFAEILVNLMGKFFMNNIMNSMYQKLLQKGHLAIGEVLDPEEAQNSAVDSYNKKMAQLLGVVGCEWENMKVVWGYFLNILDSAKIIQSLNYTTIQRDIADDAISTFKDGLNDGPKSSLKHIKLNEPTLWEGWVDDAIDETQVLIDNFVTTMGTINALSPANQDIIDDELLLIDGYLNDIENFDWYEDMETEWCDGSSGGPPCGGSCPMPDDPDRGCSSLYCFDTSYTTCDDLMGPPIQNCQGGICLCTFSGIGGGGQVASGDCAPWWAFESSQPECTSADDGGGDGGGGPGGGGGGKRFKPDPIDTQQQYKKGGRTTPKPTRRTK